MFEMALDYTKHKTEEFECLGGYMSPVNDFYKKAGLASSVHRYVYTIWIIECCAKT